jgi:phosphonate transport system substrate-binding protein
MEATGAHPILIREKDGIREYNSVVFVNKDSDIENFADLAGKVVVFQDPGSTSAYILPRNLLAEAGLELVESERPVPGKLAYYFSGDDENLLAHVKLGKADAGGVDRTAVTQLPDFRIVPPESGYVPRHVVLVRDGPDSGALKDALLKMAADPEASEVLEAIETPTGFAACTTRPWRRRSTPQWPWPPWGAILESRPSCWLSPPLDPALPCCPLA